MWGVDIATVMICKASYLHWSQCHFFVVELMSLCHQGISLSTVHKNCCTVCQNLLKVDDWFPNGSASKLCSRSRSNSRWWFYGYLSVFTKTAAPPKTLVGFLWNWIHLFWVWLFLNILDSNKTHNFLSGHLNHDGLWAVWATSTFCWPYLDTRVER